MGSRHTRYAGTLSSAVNGIVSHLPSGERCDRAEFLNRFLIMKRRLVWGIPELGAIETSSLIEWDKSCLTKDAALVFSYD